MVVTATLFIYLSIPRKIVVASGYANISCIGLTTHTHTHTHTHTQREIAYRRIDPIPRKKAPDSDVRSHVILELIVRRLVTFFRHRGYFQGLTNSRKKLCAFYFACCHIWNNFHHNCTLLKDRCQIVTSNIKHTRLRNSLYCFFYFVLSRHIRAALLSVPLQLNHFCHTVCL